MTLAAQTATPTNDLVAVAWIRAVLNQTGGVGTTLPGPDAKGALSWMQTGFVQVAAMGGASNLMINQKVPVFLIDCWAVAPGSKQPPWNSANALAEAVINGCYATRPRPLSVALPPGYPPVLVQVARALDVPRRVPRDDSSFARYQFHLELSWVGAPV